MKKTALVLGGTSGIGLGIAKTLSRNGIIVYVVGRRLSEEKYDSNVKFIQADLSKIESINKIQVALADIKLDYLVYSAATEAPLKRFSEITLEDYNYTVSLNLMVPFFLTKALLGNFNPCARLLFITSRLSASPEVGSLLYCMTKSAIEIFSAGLNKELQDKILVSSIIPGVVDTEMQKRLRDANPSIFPHASVYQEMKARLRTIESVSELIVAHLCDTNDGVFLKQRVDPFNTARESISSKL